MQRRIIRARALATDDRPLEDKLIVLSGPRIESILPSTATSRFSAKNFISARRYLVSPGLVDLHCHGGGGVDPHTRGGLLATTFFHASRGTLGLLISVFYTGLAEFAAMVQLIQEVRNQAPLRLLGLHLEGPYLNPLALGSIPAEAVRPFDPQEAKAILDASQGELRMMTFAPEMPGAEEAIRLFSQAGVVAALGHSLATAEQARAAVDWGASVVTHLGNAMRPFHQRDPGLVGEGLSNPKLVTEIIADGHHLASETLQLFLRAKAGEATLVSDCRWIGGLPEEQTAPPLVTAQGGAARLPNGMLAGGIHALWKGVQTVAALPNFTIWDAIRMATRNPGRVLGKRALGRIMVGGRADLVLAGPDFSVKRVFYGGEEIFREDSEPPLPN